MTTGAATTAQTPTTTPAVQIRGLGAATWSQLFLRVASSAGLLITSGVLLWRLVTEARANWRSRACR